MNYTGADLAILVPTKDRPAKIQALLESLVAQTEPVGRILIIDGGESVGDVIGQFGSRLPLEHHMCHPPGQIRQRNLGISLLDDRTPLVASLDDDIVLAEDAVASLIRCWNQVEPETAGVGFNITNEPREPKGWWRRLFLMSGNEPGRVLLSGMTTSNCQATETYRAQWLCGGATSWKRAVLQDHGHTEVAAKWAIAEDLIFSYPIGKVRPLYVCADARVRHEHVSDYATPSKHRYHGRTRTIWQLYFVGRHRELSILAFFWATAGSMSGRILKGLLTADRRALEFVRGEAEALVAWVVGRVRRRSIPDIIERLDRR